MTETRRLEYRSSEAYRVEGSWIRRAVGVIQSLGFQNVDISVDVGPDRQLGSLAVDELLSLPNTRAEPIRNIRLVAWRHGDDALSIAVCLYATSYELSVNGTEREAVYAFEKLKTLLGDLRVWYSSFRRDRLWISLGCATSLLAMASGSVLTLLLLLRVAGTSVPAGIFNIAIMAASIFGAAAIMTIIVEWGAKSLFPATEFLIGDGVSRSASLSETRRNILWVIIGGIVVTIGGAVLVRLLGLG